MSTNHTTCHEKKEESLILSHCLKEGWVFSAHFSAKISPILRPKDISVMLDQMTRSYGARQNSGCAILKIYMCQVLVRVTLCCVCVQFIFTILPINQRLASGALASPLIGKMALLQKWHCIPLCPTYFKPRWLQNIGCFMCFWGHSGFFVPFFLPLRDLVQLSRSRNSKLRRMVGYEKWWSHFRMFIKNRGAAAKENIVERTNLCYVSSLVV